MKDFYLFKTFKYIWKHGKVWVVFTLLSTIILGFTPIVTIWVTKELINNVTLILFENQKDYKLIFILILLQFLILVTNYTLKHVQYYIDNKTRVNLEFVLKKQVIEKTTSVSFHLFDQPDFYNHLKRIQGNQGSRFLSPLSCIFTVIQSSISAISFLIYLISINWLLVIMCIVAAIPIITTKILYGNRFFWLNFMQTPTSREAQYTQDLLTNRDQAKEVRIFNLSNFLINRWAIKYSKNMKESLNLLKKQKTTEIGLDNFSSLIFSLATAFVIFLIYKKKVGIGDFVAVGQTITSFQSSIDTISSQVGKFYENNLYIKDYFSFLDYQIELYHGTGRQSFPKFLTSGICLNNVSFKYSNNSGFAIRNINIHIKKGEKIAIVGQNGSGKTTLIKCLLGLYPLTEGRILFDNIDINDINSFDLRQNIAVIFQDFVKYHYTVKDNITFGDIENPDDNNLLSEVSARIGANTFIDNLKDKYETHLGRFLNEGTELSGGQWQKIALSRALYKDSEIIILDEPTAALDPVSEAEIFEHFREIVDDRTAIFISHKMYSTRFADRILVMKNGELVEEGTYEELMLKNGEYAQMYMKQHNLLTNKQVIVGG